MTTYSRIKTITHMKSFINKGDMNNYLRIKNMSDHLFTY